MIGKIISIILKLIQGRWAINQTKKAGLLYYLRFLSAVRKSLMGILVVIFAFQIFLFSFIGLLLTGIYLSPTDFETKIWILFGLCGFTFFLTLFVLVIAFSQKTWLKYSGAKDMILKMNM